MSPDTGFKVLTPAEVAADEEGKDPEQFGFDVSFRKRYYPFDLMSTLLCDEIIIILRNNSWLKVNDHNNRRSASSGYHRVLRLPPSSPTGSEFQTFKFLTSIVTNLFGLSSP